MHPPLKMVWASVLVVYCLFCRSATSLSQSFQAASSTKASSWRPKDWVAALTDLPFETKTTKSLRVTGDIPLELDGILYKAGPAKFGFEGEPYKHWLEGDGAVIRLELKDGKATFLSRLVETDSLVSSRRAGCIAARGTFGTQKQTGLNAFDLKLKNPANSNAIRLGDRVLAFSDVGLPYRMDPHTLDTLGEETLDGRLQSGMAAATTGIAELDEVLSFGDAVPAHYRITSRDDSKQQFLCMAAVRQGALSGNTQVRLLEFDLETGECVADATGAQLQQTGFPPHDFACTERHAIWVTTPASGSLAPYILGFKGPAECLSLKDVPASLHMLRRKGGSRTTPSVRRIVLPKPVHPIHFGNAWETAGGDVELIASCWDADTIRLMAKNEDSMLGSWSDIASGDFTGVPLQSCIRITASQSGTVEVRAVAPEILGHLDYMKCHPKYSGQKSTYTWGITGTFQESHPSPPAPPQTIFRLNVDTEHIDDWWYCGKRRFLDDFVIVPKEEGNSELDAWLIAPCFDAETYTTSFVILDGAKLRDGPLGEVRLDHHIPWALHGSWHSS